MSNLKNQLRDGIIESRMRMLNLPPEKCICIFGSPRSGSSWLMSLLAAIPRSAVVWEPEHDIHGVIDPRIRLGVEIKYKDPDDPCVELQKEFRQILSGRKLNRWTSRQSSFTEWLNARLLITKFVRANALLPWVVNNLSLYYKPIYLVRHPLAVVQSQLNSFFKDGNYQSVLLPDEPLNELYEEHFPYLKTCEHPAELLTAYWCINDMAVREKAQPDEYLKVNYESLLLQPNEVLKEIFSELGIAVPEAVKDRIRQASISDFEKLFISDNYKQLSKWLDTSPADIKDRVQKVLEDLGHREYNVYEVMPTTVNVLT